MTCDTVRCHLCQRTVPEAATSLDGDGDYWCKRDGKRCLRIARRRLLDPAGLEADILAERHSDLFRFLGGDLSAAEQADDMKEPPEEQSTLDAA